MSLGTHNNTNGVYTDKPGHSHPHPHPHPHHPPPPFPPPHFHPSFARKRFANPIPLGIAAHSLGCLVYGSYLANWRSIDNPAFISATVLGLCAPALFLAAIQCFIVNDSLWNTTFIVLSGLWAAIGIAYLPLMGYFAFFSGTENNFRTQDGSLGVLLIWFGIFIFVHGLIASRRNFIYPAITTLTSIGLWVIVASYFRDNIATSALSKAGGYLLIIAGLLGVYYIVSALLAAERQKVKLPLFGRNHGFAGPEDRDGLTGDDHFDHAGHNSTHGAGMTGNTHNNNNLTNRNTTTTNSGFMGSTPSNFGPGRTTRRPGRKAGRSGSVSSVSSSDEEGGVHRSRMDKRNARKNGSGLFNRNTGPSTSTVTPAPAIRA